MKNFRRKCSLVGGALLLLTALGFLTAGPALTHWLLPSVPSDFSFTAEVLSIDNFYSLEKNRFLGPQLSQTAFSYELVGGEDGIALIRNSFDVQSLTGEKIFSVQRIYGIDPKTGKHVPGHGDHDREGYLFAPRNLKEGEPFTYWHVNYDAPALLQFSGKEKMNGLQVYRYEANYSADQTVNLGHLPNVPETQGINLDTHLELWIEPVTGRMIMYQDHTTAYYYNLTTGKRIHIWNQFHNELTFISILNNVVHARQEKIKIQMITEGIPLIFALAGILLLFLSLSQKKGRKYRTLIFLVILLAEIGVLLSVILDVPLLISLIKDRSPVFLVTVVSFLLSGALFSLLFFGHSPVPRRKIWMLRTCSFLLLSLNTFLLLSLVLVLLWGTERILVLHYTPPGHIPLLPFPSVITLTSFILAGITGLLASSRRPHLLGRLRGCGFLLTLTALVSLTGHLLNIPLLYYQWQPSLAGMALLTSWLFLLLGTGFLFLGKRKGKS